MAIDQTLDSLGGIKFEELYDMEQSEFEAVISATLGSIADPAAKAEKFKDVKTEVQDVGELIDAQRYQLQDIIEAARKDGDMATAERAGALLKDLDGMSKFIDDFSSSWGEVDKSVQEHTQTMSATAFQFTYSSMNVVPNDVYNIDATSLGAVGGLFGDAGATAPERAYIVFNVNPGDVIAEPVLDTSGSPITLTIPITSADGQTTRYVKISASSVESMPALKLSGGVGGLTEDAMKGWSSTVLSLFYESVTAEHSFNYYINGSDESTATGGKGKGGLLNGNAGKLIDQVKTPFGATNTSATDSAEGDTKKKTKKAGDAIKASALKVQATANAVQGAKKAADDTA